jgi:hypothetical protein
MDIYRELYHGWLIVVFQDVHQWLIECHPPAAEAYITPSAYETPAVALCAARIHISTKLARSALIQALI